MSTFGKFLLGAAVLFSAGRARATLGGDVASVAADQARFTAEHRLEKFAAGERHELRLPSGIVVVEYVSPGGTVYGVAWRGPRMPDLGALLGPFFEPLSKHQLTRRGGHHAVDLKGDDLVVQSSGHRRSFAGRAWIPSLVPAGLDPATTIEYRH